MAKDLLDMIMPDDSRMLEAIDAMKRYHEAQSSGFSEIEVERLRVITEFMFQAIADYNLQALRRP